MDRKVIVVVLVVSPKGCIYMIVFVIFVVVASSPATGKVNQDLVSIVVFDNRRWIQILMEWRAFRHGRWLLDAQAGSNRREDSLFHSEFGWLYYFLPFTNDWYYLLRINCWRWFWRFRRQWVKSSTPIYPGWNLYIAIYFSGTHVVIERSVS